MIYDLELPLIISCPIITLPCRGRSSYCLDDNIQHSWIEASTYVLTINMFGARPHLKQKPKGHPHALSLRGGGLPLKYCVAPAYFVKEELM